MELVSIETEAEHTQMAAFLLEHQPSKLQISRCSTALMTFFDDRLQVELLYVCPVQ
jgi:hypothetical protein